MTAEDDEERGGMHRVVRILENLENVGNLRKYIFAQGNSVKPEI